MKADVSLLCTLHSVWHRQWLVVKVSTTDNSCAGFIQTPLV